MSTRNSSSELLLAISVLKGKKLRKVSYYYWVNNFADSGFRSLDWIEFTTHDLQKIYLKKGEDDSSISVADFNFDIENDQLYSRFGDSVFLEYYNATLDQHWFPVLDSAIQNIEVKGSGTNRSIYLFFEDNHPIEITTDIDNEGMIVDFYE